MTKAVIIIFFCVLSKLIPTQPAMAQLSKDLLAVLPDSCKPIPLNKKTLSIEEEVRIIRFEQTGFGPRLYKEVDSIAEELAKKNALLQDNEKHCLNLSIIVDYYFLRGDFKNAFKYCDILLTDMKGGLIYESSNIKNRKENQVRLPLRVAYERQKGAIYSLLGDHEASIIYLNTALDKNKALNDTLGIAQVCFALATPYMNLQLYPEAINSLDSCRKYQGWVLSGNKRTESSVNKEIFRSYYTAVALQFINYFILFYESNNAKYIQNFKEIDAFAKKEKLLIPTFYSLIPVFESYSNKDYNRCYELSDSLFKDSAQTHTISRFLIKIAWLEQYRAISLFNMGEKEKAALLLEAIVKQLTTERKGVERRFEPLYIIRDSKILYDYYSQVGNWEKAFYYLRLSKHTEDSLNVLTNRGKVFETNQKYNFAKKEAEVKQLEADNTIRKKERDTAITATIAAVLSLILIATLLMGRYKKLQLKKQLAEQDAQNQVERLNLASQIQIDELEEKSRIAKAEEQKRLGQELHDDLAGTLAAAKMKLENEAIKNSDSALHERLKDIAAQITTAYESTRNKSHDWYNAANEKGDIAFSKRIKLITENVLTDKDYKKDIIVDETAVKNISLPAKINILRIIQETLINILKHASAHVVSIIIYEGNSNTTILKIADDGKGFNTAAEAGKTSKGIGLKSIQERVNEMDGTLHIESTATGTVIHVTVPHSHT